jgi:serine/threonine protein kinase
MQGEIVGTLQYMSPEQLHGTPADARSDIFAFGCVLYEMLSGRRAFDGSSQASVIAAILEREPPSLLRSFGEPGPVAITDARIAAIDRIIATCLART